jgi:methylmalonyl-CoA mutase C-terminal domain/subunit
LAGIPVNLITINAQSSERGIVIAAALRDAGMEVICTGLRQTPDMIVEAALQEDVDVIGISMLSGAHMTLFPNSEIDG